MTATSALILTDGQGGGHSAARSDDDVVVQWQDAPAPESVLSLPALVDASSDRLRAEYLQWCNALADVPVGAGTLVGALTNRLLYGGSFWWTTLIAARSPISSPGLVDVFKLRMLETLYVSGGYRSLRYRGADRRLAGVLRSWCAALGHEFVWHRTAPADSNAAANEVVPVERLPQPILALRQLAYFLRRRYLPGLRVFGRRPKPTPDAGLAVFTYFPNIDLAEAKKGRFRSQYWGSLHDLIAELGLKVNWIWFYHDSHQMTYREALAFRERLNEQSTATDQRFLMLEDRLTLPAIASAVLSYLQLLIVSLRVTRIRERFTFAGSTLNFFDILQDEWYASLRGAAAMSACLYAAAFRRTVDALPSTTARMIYPWENQGWEQSLLSVWKGSRKAPTFAVVHTPSPTAPMYLRTYLGDERVGDPPKRPIPDRLIAFGGAAARVLVAWGWPSDIVTEAEALRYMGLAGKYGAARRVLPQRDRRLLLVTGIMRSETAFQLKLLSDASNAGALAAYSSVTLKPHPFCPVEALVAALSFSHQVAIDHRALDALFQETDVVFAGNSTSAAIEAAWLGLPLILTAAVDGLNLSPLYGIDGATFVRTASALAEQLRAPTRVELRPDTFLLDRDLPRWRAFLTQPLSASTREAFVHA
jgi:surface carbohydrate biosynthesis protein (TIGR04326 family)